MTGERAGALPRGSPLASAPPRRALEAPPGLRLVASDLDGTLLLGTDFGWEPSFAALATAAEALPENAGALLGDALTLRGLLERCVHALVRGGAATRRLA